jgi:DNA segregation ATPase FtsK/SpoIIIE-like protein
MNERRSDQFERQHDHWELMKLIGAQNNARFLDMWLWGNSPLRNGKDAAHFQDQLENKLAPLKLALEIARTQVRITEVDPSRAIPLGYELGTNRPIVVDIDVLNRHLLVIGSTGSGKTTFLARIIDEVIKKRPVSVLFQDHKGEGRRLLNIYSR